MRTTSLERTREILERVSRERLAQEIRYGEQNAHCLDGTGPDTCWLLPYTGANAVQIEADLRGDYEEFEEESLVTWAHLVREEIAEAFKESDPTRLQEELIQVAALCVSWAERLCQGTD